MYANVFELSKCLDDCIEYCRNHSDQEHARFHLPLLQQARRQLDETTDRAEKEMYDWKAAFGQDKLALKTLSKKLRSIQDQLDKVNAIGYIDQTVMYWDRKPLLAATNEMIDYLREREDALDFAADAADKLERLRDKALNEGEESDRAREEYLRFSKMRADGLITAKETIANFRKALRRELGRSNEDYQAIQWPQQVAPDERVL